MWFWIHSWNKIKLWGNQDTGRHKLEFYVDLYFANLQRARAFCWSEEILIVALFHFARLQAHTVASHQRLHGRE